VQHPLTDAQHGDFDTLLKEAFSRDATLRMAGQYDAQSALGEIASHYAPRQGAGRDMKTH
jgi:hypothetical protein